ncbi:MAG: prepilin-type N-terminal cleavage/methylation domain-containing protein [Dehalococcoidales bacterium]|jgi:prepilin-type N-terminal cleavage/methylation domain-containing protein
MIRRKLGKLAKDSAGFTLIEVLVALVITSLIGFGAAITVNQVMTQGSRNGDYTTASWHAMNAIYWIGRDAQMSQVITPGGVYGFPLTINWTEWDNSEYEVTYTIEDNQLKRSYAVDGGEPSQSVVAQYINATSENTSCQFIGGVFTLKINTTVGEGATAVSITKLREITPRPGL